MSTSAIPDFEAPSTKVLSPAYLAHAVLRTGNLQRMTDFYLEFLGGRLTHGNDKLRFLTYDDEHHRIALLGVPSAEPKNHYSCGLEHIAFTYSNLADLLVSYRQRKARGIEPIWSVNHGPTTSIYYRDPDGNMLETQVDNFDTIEGVNEFLMGKEFAENPIGTDFDPEELIAAIKSGEDEAVLKKRREIGSRDVVDTATLGL